MRFCKRCEDYVQEKREDKHGVLKVSCPKCHYTFYAIVDKRGRREQTT